jgi:hypothetical protein
MIKPFKTLLFLLSVFIVFLGISFFFPSGKKNIAKITLYVPSTDSLLGAITSKPAMAEQPEANKKPPIMLNAEVDSNKTVLPTPENGEFKKSMMKTDTLTRNTSLAYSTNSTATDKLFL